MVVAVKSPTPLQAQRLTQIAKLICDAMTRLDMSPAQVNVAMGNARGAPGIYHWMKGKGGPSPENRALLAKVLHIDAAALDYRQDAPERPSTALVPVEQPKPSRRVQAPAISTPTDTIVIEVGGYRVEVRKL